MYTSYYLEGVEMKWCQIWLRIEFLIWSHLSSCAVMQGFAQPGTHLLPVCLSVWVSLCLSVHCVWRPQPPIQTSSDKTVGLACQSQTFKMVFGDCRDKKKKNSLKVWSGAAPPSGLFVPLHCLRFRNAVVHGIKLLAWFEVGPRNHDSLRKQWGADASDAASATYERTTSCHWEAW